VLSNVLDCPARHLIKEPDDHEHTNHKQQKSSPAQGGLAMQKSVRQELKNPQQDCFLSRGLWF
jgi:hypothetical protein